MVNTACLSSSRFPDIMKESIRHLFIAISLSGMIVNSNSSAQIVLQRCDVKNLWQGSNPIGIDTQDRMEGVASIRFSGSGTVWFEKRFSQTDVGIDENGWFHFWLFISDTGMMNGEGEVELSSSGGPDVDVYSWQLSSLGLTDGWNQVMLPISAANKLGSPDLNSINFFRILQPLSGEVTTRLDELKFTNSVVPLMQTDPLAIKSPDYSTLDGKVMFGYQGWFSTPGDGSEYDNWRHWGSMQDESSIGVEILPEMEEYEADERFITGLTFPDGRPVRVYSAYNRKTVTRHMKWLRDYDLDGVFLQRFYASIQDAKLRALRDTVTANVRYGCERYDRAFVNMYDLSWSKGIEINKLIADWKHLVDDLRITESPNYLWHRGKPLVALWGFTNRDNLEVSQLEQAMEFFKHCPEERYRATVMLGTNQDFHTQSAWQEALSEADVISPWTVGRYSNPDGHMDFINKHILPGQDWCDQRNIDFLPVIWPGFSWYNIKRAGEYQKNQIPRNGGNFYWMQSTRTVSSNAKMVYIAMFDEVDEGTAMYKLAETHEDSPAQGFWVALDQDGYDLPCDWYLRCAKLTTQVVRGTAENRLDLDTPPDGLDRYRVEVQSTKCGITPGKLTFHYPETDAGSILQFSIDGGSTYPYSTPVNSTVLETGDLNSGVHEVWMRRSNGSMPTDLGSYTVFDVQPDAIIRSKKSSCGMEDGELTLVVGDNPYVGPLQFSIDGGKSYPLSSEEGTWSYQIPNLPAGAYPVWARWEDELCPTELGTATIEEVAPVPVTLYYSIEGGAFVQAEGKVIRGCAGKSLDITAEPAEDSWTWTWTGDYGFDATGRSIRFADTLDAEVFGIYSKFYVSYLDVASGCELKNQEFVIREGSNCSVGIEGHSASAAGFRIYPNPVDGIVCFHQKEATIDFIEISDVSGRSVFSGTPCFTDEEVRIDLSSCKAGIYLYRIRSGEDEHYVGRFVISR